MDASVAQSVVSRIVEEISHEAANRQRSREGCPLLYQVIADGDAKVVDDVMQRLEPKVRKWILGLQKPEIIHATRGVTSARCGDYGRAISLILTAITFVILTPLFYIIHSLITSFHRHWQLRASRRQYPVPLFSAAVSGRLDVMAVLLMHGSDYSQTDDDLNNILHYLSLVSADDPVAALRGYQGLWGVLEEGEGKTMKDLLHGKNKEGLCPAEHCSLYGALKLCTEFINDLERLDLLMAEAQNKQGSNVIASEMKSLESDTLLTAGLDLAKQRASDDEESATRVTVDNPKMKSTSTSYEREIQRPPFSVQP